MMRCVLLFRCRFEVLLMLLLVVFTTTTSAANYFTINIGSSLKQAEPIALKNPALAQKYIVYSVKLDINGISRYRQRVGFFASKDEARSVLTQLSAQFPGAWIDTATPEEEDTLNNWLTSSASTFTALPVMAPIALPELTASISNTSASTTTPETTGKLATSDTATAPATSAAVTSTDTASESVTADTLETQQELNLHNKRLEKLMIDAKAALVEKNYSNAIQIYNRVISEGDSPYRQEAQEYLGVARERNGQLAHATAEYRKYLELYPAGEDADRVKQRLTGLVTAADKPKAKMIVTDEKKEPSYWESFGTAYQFYDRDTIKTSAGDRFTANSMLTSGVNFNSRLMNGDYKMRANLAAIHIYDFLEGETEDTRINEMYFDMISPEQTIDTRIGRQKGRSSGVIGRFDGFDVGYRFNPSHQVKLIAGYPVEFSGSSVPRETDKHFISLGYFWTGFLPNWEANFFTLQQVAEGITDREEIGAELRYRTAIQSLFAVVDYSTAFGEINYLMMIYNRLLPDQATIDLIADYRKSPFLTTSSSLQGQANASSLGDLTVELSEEELAQLALDQTGLYKSLTALYTRPINENLEFNTDFSVTNLSGTSGTTGSGIITDVPPQEGTGNEYGLAAGLISTNLLMENDINIVNVRYGQLFNSNILLLTGSAKYRVRNDWKIGPKLSWGTRDYDDGRSSDRLAPSVRIEYRQNKNWQFDSELTFESRTTTSLTGEEKESNYFIHLGYYYIF